VRLYETTFILNPQTDDTTIDRQIKAIIGIITGNGGKVVIEDRIGSRRLSFQINKLSQGYYTSLVFQAPTSVLPLIERHYKLDDSYMRHLTILFTGDPEKVKEQQIAFASALEAQERAEPHRSGQFHRESSHDRGGYGGGGGRGRYDRDDDRRGPRNRDDR